MVGHGVSTGIQALAAQMCAPEEDSLFYARWCGTGVGLRTPGARLKGGFPFDFEAFEQLINQRPILITSFYSPLDTLELDPKPSLLVSP